MNLNTSLRKSSPVIDRPVHLDRPSHYLNQYWNIVNWTIRNWTTVKCAKLYIFFQENVFENSVSKMAVILLWPQCVNILRPRKMAVTIQMHVSNIKMLSFDDVIMRFPSPRSQIDKNLLQIHIDKSLFSPNMVCLNHDYTTGTRHMYIPYRITT